MRFAANSWRRWRGVAAVSLAVAILYVGLRWPLLHGRGVVELTWVDSSIIALMGKKMLDGRGFDIFCWGSRHLGPLTSMITAGWAWLLSAFDFGRLWPLAVRLASMTEVALGIALMAWTTARIDRRAAAIVAAILAAGPPALFRISIIPLGHEMAFVIGAAILAVAMQHLTAPAGRGWLDASAGRCLFGVLSGVGWWMNRIVALALGAVLIVMILRSELFARIRRTIRLSDRLLLRAPAGAQPLPGFIEAIAFVLHWGGLAWIAYDIAYGFVRLPQMPFLLSPILDGIVLATIAQMIVLVPRLRRHHWNALRLSSDERRESRGAIEWIAGFAIGYAPAFVATALDWYPDAYAAGLQIHEGGGGILHELQTRGPELLRRLVGLDPRPAGIVYGAAVAAIGVAALVRHRRDIARYFALEPSREWGARALLASVLVTSIAFALLVQRAMRPRYLLIPLGPFFALMTLEALHWWDSRRRASRALVAIAFGTCMISVVTGAILERTTIYPTPDVPLVVDRVRKLECRVCYLAAWNTYEYRLLSNEEIAWIPYVGHDHSPADTAAALALPGRRCFVTTDGAVMVLARGLGPKKKGRYIPTRDDYLKP